MSKKFKLFIIFAAVIFAAGAGWLFVNAQSIIDSFIDSNRVEDAWNVEVDTGNGQVKLAEKTCDDNVWDCAHNDVCANTLGDGNYIIVADANEATTKQWKTAATACDLPQCGIDGGQDGDNLAADNTVVFADYPARLACEAKGGRLPTKTELQCIYTNRVTFGDNFGTGYHWSSTEASAANAWLLYFLTGTTSNGVKTPSYSVRCVRGW